MIEEVDTAYLRKRFAEERERARTAESDVARSAHRRLAELYEATLDAPAPPPYQRRLARAS